jgi:serine/threonine protein kinase
MIGKSLSHYQIISLIGKGGMGEVYQARDQKLGRDVAIKVLPEEFAKDADRVARFQREAKLLASLNHPNIAAIYGLEESDGTHFLVMELIEGETLVERIKGGPVPVEEALKLALQITEALEAAHEKGVIHRDLKPANIKVTTDGKVKVLDFGLAKAFAGEQQVNLSNSPTLSDAATQAGVILGTAAYMPPEQARGNPVDKRADIWAFGVVLFEMLIGRQIFSEDTVSDTLASVLKTEPEWNSLPSNLHPRIRLLLEHCLEKDPKNRYHDIADARVDIQKVLADPSGIFVQPVTAELPQKKLRTILPWVVAAIVAGGVAVWLLKPAPPPEPKQVMYSEYMLPEDQHFFHAGTLGVQLAVSPDGSQFAYATTKGIYIRSMNELDAQLISGTDEEVQSLFFSPDGQWIGYFSLADHKLKIIPVSGGAPTDLCDAGFINGRTWNKDNTIVYTDLTSGVYRIPAKGGTPEVLVERSGLAGAKLLPDGKSLMFTDVSSQPFKTIVQSLETGEQTIVFDKGAGWYLPTGHFVYFEEGSMFAVPFDLDKLEFTGRPVSVMTTGVGTTNAISDSGTLIYVPGTLDLEGSSEQLKSTLVWVTRQGKVDPIPISPNNYTRPRISPDGRKVAVTIPNEEDISDIYILDLNSVNMDRRTFNKNSRTPLWTSDSQRIVYVAGDEDNEGIYWRAADGRGTDELLILTPDGESLSPQSWADDGKTLLTTKMRFPAGLRMRGPGMMRGRMRGSRGLAPKRSPEFEASLTSEEMQFGMYIGTLSMEGDPEWKQLLHFKSGMQDFQISPDGKWIAYSSWELEQSEISVSPFPDMDDGRWQAPTGGATNPLWSPNGRELFYFNLDYSLMAVEVETEPKFKYGKPQFLFNPMDIGVSILPWNIDISLDGNRFLMVKPLVLPDDESQAEEPTESEPNKIIVVTNWFEELKEKAPVE